MLLDSGSDSDTLFSLLSLDIIYGFVSYIDDKSDLNLSISPVSALELGCNLEGFSFSFFQGVPVDFSSFVMLNYFSSRASSCF